jgi:uncharacterized protein YjdB
LPTFTTTPPNLILNGVPNTAVASFSPPTATDNWSSVTITSNPANANGASFPIGTNNIVWTATDTSGNAATYTQTITVRDVTSPVFTSTPQNITVNGAPNCTTVSLTPPSATDNWSSVTITRNPEGSTFCIGTTAVMWTATDAAGNTASVTQNVSVRDVTAPMVTTPQLLNVNGAPCTAVVTLTPPAATDNIGIASITRIPSGDTFSVGTTSVEWTVTDNSGNATAVTQQVVVADVTPPTVVTRNLIGQLGANGTLSITDAAVDNGSSDTCGPVSLSLSQKTFDCSNIGTNTVTLTVTDNNGNSAQANAIVIVQGTSIMYYLDDDRDGFGNPQSSVTLCSTTSPIGYVTNNTDCDDTRSSINPNTVWYKDADNDGYSDGTTVTQCLQPLGYRLESELVATSGDCNDSDAAINSGATEVCGNGKDDDCNLATSEVCVLPDTDEDGVPDGEDCAPNDATKYRTANFFIDADNDGFDRGMQEVCYGAAIPSGYKNTTLGPDCDDTDASISVTRTWYQDADNDGYSNGNTLTQCTRPQGYKLSSELTATTGDCNDNNSAINPGATEACDGIDNNCNGQKDEGFADVNNNGIADCVDPDIDMISFTLINAATDLDILTLTNGLQISQNQVQGLSLNIRANTNPSVIGSVFFTLSGPVNRTITENVAPYALFGDNNGNYSGRPLPAGNYTLTATPYSQSNRRGTAGATTTIQFSIVPVIVSVTGITTTPSTASLFVGQSVPITATVLPSNATNNAVVWSTSNPNVASVSTNGLVTALGTGEAIITATTQDGNFFDTTELTVIQSNSLSIASFTLVNAGTDTDVLTLTDGLRISQSQVQGLSLNIRANTNPPVVGSVLITLSGPVNRTITENVAPYALFGDRNGNYSGRNLPVGNYILTATPYSQSNRRGTVGITQTIRFSITSEVLRVDSTQTESRRTGDPFDDASMMNKEPRTRDIPRIIRVYPNPVSEVINLELSERMDQKVEISIYDLKGVRVFIRELEPEDGKLALDISNLGLKPGFFILLVNTNGYPQTFKFLKK